MALAQTIFQNSVIPFLISKTPEGLDFSYFIILKSWTFSAHCCSPIYVHKQLELNTLCSMIIDYPHNGRQKPLLRIKILAEYCVQKKRFSRQPLCVSFAAIAANKLLPSFLFVLPDDSRCDEYDTVSVSTDNRFLDERGVRGRNTYV